MLFSDPRFGVSASRSVCFVVSRCVPREHPPIHLGRGHHDSLASCLEVIFGTAA